MSDEAQVVDMRAWGQYVRDGRGHFDRVVRSFNTFGRNARELVMLLHSVETDPVKSLTLMTDSDGPLEGAEAFRTEFWAQVDQRLHNMVSAAIALVDHTRPLVKFYEQYESDFTREFAARSQAVAQSPRAVFLRRLRNYLVHCGVAPTMQTMRLGEVAAEDWDHLRIQLSAAGLLRWDGWNGPSREFIESHDGGPALREVTQAYFDDMRKLYEWLFQQYAVLHVPGVPPKHLQGAAEAS
ncbi:hypothetical protein [Micromonospora globbae]|uniref:hypothetical protein n=1 Tax=Micromonospora globbae TaxID=1894969 RepID=UPI00341F6179